MKPIILCLFAALALQGGANVARACQYCRLAASDPEMARLAAEMHAKSGGFPLDATINRFQSTAASPILTAPPAAASITTRAADLPTTSLPAATTHRLPPPAPAASHPATIAKATPAATTSSSADRWANGGLLGLLGVAGVFGWRTRRTARAVS